MLIPFAVTDKHLALGARADCASCPVAIALANALPVGTRVEVHADRVLLNGKLVAVSQRLEMFIRAIDSGATPRPQAFVLDTDVPFTQFWKFSGSALSESPLALAQAG